MGAKSCRAVGYIFEHDGQQFDPNGWVDSPVADVAAHNATLSRSEAEWFTATQPPAHVGYLAADRTIKTWGGAVLLHVVRSAEGRRWNPFGGRWDRVTRGHAHTAGACYTFSGAVGMLTRVRRVKPCPAARRS